MELIKYNNNPGNLNIGDCSVRAIAAALDITWGEALMDLSRMSCDTFRMPMSRYNIDKYLVAKEWIKNPGKNKKLKDFRFKSTHICMVKFRNKYHLTYVENGKIKDTWDCSEWRVVDYYSKPK